MSEPGTLAYASLGGDRHLHAGDFAHSHPHAGRHTLDDEQPRHAQGEHGLMLSGSVALLADLIHNFGDALTALPLGIAFLLRSARAERMAGLAVVAAIFVSACVAAVEAVNRLLDPSTPDHLLALAGAGAIGFLETSSPPTSARAPAVAWTAPRSSRTGPTRAPTPTSRWR